MINLSRFPLDSTIELLDVSDFDDSLRLTKSNRTSFSLPVIMFPLARIVGIHV
ncbi:hypothetical protein HNR31_001352 [Anoxybacillus caldiproteolyticus]|uniref:Uncharacterized protein n=1 Tax=Thermaerobacillus caldiproteolyticus TaxID=247480 RepID=A0A7V9Z5T5_9BACL|nr:hypothetical protein [Anoxybacillus caldiproteolyticus]